MGTSSSKKFIKQSAGVLTEESALTTTAGAADANRIPALNDNGVLDPSIVNASVSASANKIAQLDGSGRLDASVMPVGFGADTGVILASENLAAGDLVNVWNNAGTANVRKADGSIAGREAHGFVLSATTASTNATVYFEGTNTQVSGLTPGVQFLSATAGLTTSTPLSGAGQVSQVVGFAVSATEINFQSERPIILA